MIVLIFVFLCITFTYGEVVSPTHNYNVTLPEPNAPYVAGQMLPIAYTSPADANIEKLLQLSVYLTTQDPSLNFTDVLITSNADISQTFSFKRYRLNDIYYEHQLNYAIPNNTIPGNYVVLFVDSVSKYNTSVPILIRPYAAPVATLPTNGNKARPSGSIFATHNSEANQLAASSTVLFLFVICGLLLL